MKVLIAIGLIVASGLGFLVGRLSGGQLACASRTLATAQSQDDRPSFGVEDVKVEYNEFGPCIDVIPVEVKKRYSEIHWLYVRVKLKKPLNECTPSSNIRISIIDESKNDLLDFHLDAPAELGTTSNPQELAVTPATDTKPPIIIKLNPYPL